MVRQVVWTNRAQNDRIEILAYWSNRNKSAIYSLKLNDLIKDSLKLICKHPLIGRITDKENVRVKVLRDYLIIYELTDNYIVVLSIWDRRQDPEDLKRIIL